MAGIPDLSGLVVLFRALVPLAIIGLVTILVGGAWLVWFLASHLRWAW